MADERLSPAGIPVSPVYRPGDTVVNYAHDLADRDLAPIARHQKGTCPMDMAVIELSRLQFALTQVLEDLLQHPTMRIQPR